MQARHWLIVALTVAAPATAFAWHNRLLKSAPGADASAAAPKEIRLWFAEQVEPKFSSISLLKSDSTKIDIGKAQGTDDPKSIAAPVSTVLTPGGYVVVWRTAGDDGHAVRGKYAFTVK